MNEENFTVTSEMWTKLMDRLFALERMNGRLGPQKPTAEQDEEKARYLEKAIGDIKEKIAAGI